MIAQTVPARLVFGTATGKWYLVGEKDRDYANGIDPERFALIGEAAARAEYLAPSMVGGVR